jgi:hypothetical protein
MVVQYGMMLHTTYISVHAFVYVCPRNLILHRSYRLFGFVLLLPPPKLLIEPDAMLYAMFSGTPACFNASYTSGASS